MINTKASKEQTNQLLNDKISKNEVLFYLSNKASIDDVNNILEEKIGIREYEDVMNQINSIKKEKIDVNIFNSEIQNIKNILDNKTNSIDVINALDTKVDKEELNLELTKLNDKNESNKLLKDKIEQIENEKMFEILNEKISNKKINQFQKFEEILKEKADNSDFSLIKDAFQDMKLKMTQRIDDIDNDLDRLIDNIKSQFISISEDMKKLEKNINENSYNENINKILENKIDVNDLAESMNLLKNNIFQTMNSYIKEINENQKIFEEKIMSNLDKIFKDNKYLKENMNLQNMTVKGLFNNKSNYGKEIDDFKFSEMSKNIIDFKSVIKTDMENIINILNNKIDTNIMNEEILKMQNKFETKINALNESQDNIILEVNNKIKEMYDDISKELSNKISLTDAKLLITDNTSNNIKQDNIFNDNGINEMKKELKQKLDVNLFNKVISQFNINFENIKKDINSTNDNKEMSKSLNTKINNEQFNNFAIDINKKLNEKVNITDFTTSIDNQAIINDTLCNENCVGRWFWQSGNVKNNYIIPWENQSVNTSPDNFIWEKDKTFILVNEEGFYELNLGFYSEKRPSIQVVVNGEIIINSQNNIMNKRLIGKNNDKNNNIGLSIIEFILLKKQSKISILFYGTKGTGFMGLKKL